MRAPIHVNLGHLALRDKIEAVVSLYRGKRSTTDKSMANQNLRPKSSPRANWLRDLSEFRSLHFGDRKLHLVWKGRIVATV